MKIHEIFLAGGDVMWVLLGISVLAMFTFLDKLLELHRSQIASRDFLDGIYNVLRRGNAPEAITICEDTPGPVAHLVRAAILKVDDPPEEMSKAIQHAGLAEIPRLQHKVTFLGTLGRVTPLIGLLGTLLGMMHTFRDLQQAAPLAHAGDMGGGLWEAMISSAFALVIAIPIYIGYNMLVSRVDALVLEMEYASADIFTFLTRNRELFTRR